MVEEVSMKNTKKEMLEIINTLQLQIKEKAKTKLDPEKIKKETKNHKIKITTKKTNLNKTQYIEPRKKSNQKNSREIQEIKE